MIYYHVEFDLSTVFSKKFENIFRPAGHTVKREGVRQMDSNMGVINAVKNLKKYPDADRDTRGLMERLLKGEEDNVQQLKKFL